MPKPVTLSVIVERKHPRTPRFVVIPTSAVAAWDLDGTTVVECKVNGSAVGRRSLKRWGEHRWFIDLPDTLCRRAKVDTGDRVKLTLHVASRGLPEELTLLIASDPNARQAWEALSGSQQRMLREHVIAAKRATTRGARARKALRTAAS